MTAATPDTPGRYTVINPEFTWFISGRILFIGGLRMIPVLLGWKLYELTGSKLALGMLGLSEVIPAILLALPAGVRVDRSDKRKLITTCMFFYWLIILGLLLITFPGTEKFLNRTIEEWTLYGLVFFTGVIRAFSSPAFNAFLPQVVTGEDLVKAISINSMSWLIAAVAGPALAGLLLGYSNITVSFCIVAVFVGMGLLLFRKIGSKPISWDPGKTKTWDSVKEGLRFVLHQRALLGAMSLDMFAVLFGGAIALLPVFAKDILHAGPEGLGLLRAGPAVGATLTALSLARWPVRRHAGRLLLVVVALFGLATVVFGLSRNLWLSLASLLAAR